MLRGENERLRYEAEQMAAKYEQERQTLEIMRKLYNNAFAKEGREVQTQTEVPWLSTKPLVLRRPESGRLP